MKITWHDQLLDAKQKDPDAYTSTMERQIDQMVYKLYGLTEKEIKIVEGEINRMENPDIKKLIDSTTIVKVHDNFSRSTISGDEYIVSRFQKDQGQQIIINNYEDYYRLEKIMTDIIDKF